MEWFIPLGSGRPGASRYLFQFLALMCSTTDPTAQPSRRCPKFKLNPSLPVGSRQLSTSPLSARGCASPRGVFEIRKPNSPLIREGRKERAPTAVAQPHIRNRRTTTLSPPLTPLQLSATNRILLPLCSVSFVYRPRHPCRVQSDYPFLRLLLPSQSHNASIFNHRSVVSVSRIYSTSFSHSYPTLY